MPFEQRTPTENGEGNLPFFMSILFLLQFLGYPVQGPITQDPSPMHQAVDIACITGSPVIATHDGFLRRERSPLMGNTAEVKGENYQSYYAHLDTVIANGPVTRGSVIGTCGNTGTLSTGPHLHYNIVKF